MKTLLLVLFVASSLTAQTRGELDTKYGRSDGNLYRVRPGIAMEVTFSEDDKVRTLRIVPDDPKDKSAFLRADDARKVIGEIVGGRMCRRPPQSSSRIDIDCPPRKGCLGVKQDWKNLTTVMVWYKDSLVYALVTLSDPPPTPPPGNMKLLPDYEHFPGCGIDTTVGDIKKVGGIGIRYDIGQMAGNFAKRYTNPNIAEWTRTEQVGEDSVLIVLTKENRIYATFEKAAANFFAKTASQSDIDDFLKMVLTYKPYAN